ncbi:MAG: DUF4212 domain-containing protein [Methyloceanibacter sp.]|uniref:DUF4212 domain-containing protein n=1 Tax=Methyloceanibacter sp. TaxID=1965321 RepID=UPI003D9BA3A3
MASEAPEQSARDRHQIRTLLYAIAVLVLMLLAVVMTILAAQQLNQYPFLFFPLGFYMLAQGLLIFIVAATFWFARAQQRIDTERSESAEF